MRNIDKHPNKTDLACRLILFSSLINKFLSVLSIWEGDDMADSPIKSNCKQRITKWNN